MVWQEKRCVTSCVTAMVKYMWACKFGKKKITDRDELKMSRVFCKKQNKNCC